MERKNNESQTFTYSYPNTKHPNTLNNQTTASCTLYTMSASCTVFVQILLLIFFFWFIFYLRHHQPVILYDLCSCFVMHSAYVLRFRYQTILILVHHNHNLISHIKLSLFFPFFFSADKYAPGATLCVYEVRLTDWIRPLAFYRVFESLALEYFFLCFSFFQNTNNANIVWTIFHIFFPVFATLYCQE